MKRVLILALLVACKNNAPAAAPDAGALDPADSKALLAEVDRLKDQLKDKPKTFEVLAALGNLYYENTRYLEAVDAYREAEALSAPAEGERDALRARGVKPAADLPAECRRSGTEYGLAQIAAAAKALDAPRQLRCLDGALEMAFAARARRGNALYLTGNPDAALKEHQRVLQESPDYPESLFFVGAILLEQSQGDKAKLAEGKRYWQRLLQVAPDHPRAALVKDSLPHAEEIFAPRGNAMPPGHPPVASSAQGQLPPGHPPIDSSGASGQLPPGHPPLGQGGRDGSPMAHSGPTPEEVANVADAVQGTERTPELEKGLDDLVAEGERDLDAGKYQEARDAVVRVMPMRPTDAHTAAVLGGAMRGLGRADMAERTLQRALQLDPHQPRALFELARLQAARGDATAARESFKAVSAADPKFAAAHGVSAELANLK